jgi:hypothetical protein
MSPLEGEDQVVEKVDADRTTMMPRIRQHRGTSLAFIAAARRTMTRRILVGSALIGVLGMTAAAAPQVAPIEHFTARAVESASPARFVFHPVDIIISRWSTLADHVTLTKTLLEQGPWAYLNTLCGFGPVGNLRMGGRDFPLRYAWSIERTGGGRRIFLATDEPVSLANPVFGPFIGHERLTFLELRVNRNGEGEGKFSEAGTLSVDESWSVIEVHEYDRSPVRLVMVRSETE